MVTLRSSAQPEPAAEIDVASGDDLVFVVARTGAMTTLQLSLGDISRTYTLATR